MFDQVIPAADKDVVKVFTKRISKKFNLMLETKVTAVEAKEDGIYVSMEGKKAPAEAQRYDAVLVAIGRVPNGKNLDAGKAGVEVDERGFIRVDKQLRTNVPHIFAIGDIVGQPMLGAQRRSRRPRCCRSYRRHEALLRPRKLSRPSPIPSRKLRGLV
ncbi:dihydrolipoamide dehydrogenase of pyruvate dehydrogenase complex [Klebsiella michiganensis]|nr:dihydrolipoamide dehydrogenase of pyruvate dehydrogenase complex [Klebsiella michiganensis]